jgi:outer membrane murein-binding lipoprotein Lpp
VKKFFVSAVAAVLTVVVLAGCSSDADTADRNIVTAA